MAEFKAGDRVRIVEHIDSTRQPRPGGKVIPATVTDLPGIYVMALPDEGHGVRVKPDQFYAESGWRAWDGEFRWRLLPTNGEGAQ